MGLDLIGQASLFLELAGQLEGHGRDGDRLAFHRDVLAYRNCLLVEQPNEDFARTMARQFLFSTYQQLFFDALAASTEPRIAEIAAKAVKEVRYHAELSADWIVRLGDGTAESRERMIDGLDWHWRLVDELFQVDAIEQRLVDAGIAADRAGLRNGFDATVARVLTEATLPLPIYPRAVVGGRKGHHSEHLGHLLAVMQYVPRAYPDATW
jgi:ring-1,2-phenylacetyl-CoA epoxidase subunit PaaC